MPCESIGMATPTLAVVCAWCNRVVTPAPAGAHVTHTICPSCMEWAFVHRTTAMPPEKSGDSLPADYFGVKSSTVGD
jgi:hypothetical protein